MIAISALTAWLPLRTIGLSWLSRQGPAGSDRSDGRLLRSANDVAAMRELARRHTKTNPSYAADLMAAADRHQDLIAKEKQR